MNKKEISVEVITGGGELTIATMDEYSRLEIGRKTYEFAKRVMSDPILREKVKQRAAEIRAAEAQKERNE